jgi:phosphatidate cytidylyltransferase
MTRVLSGVVLGAAFFTIVWFGTTVVLLGVAMAVCVLAFREYADLMAKLHAQPPRLLSLAATLAALTMVPYPRVSFEMVAAIALMGIAIAEMARLKPGPPLQNPMNDGRPGFSPANPAGVSRAFTPAILATASGALAMLYLGLPLGALVAVHQIGGRGAVLLLVATVALSDTAQYYSGRTFGRRPLAPQLSPKKTIEGAIGGFVAAPIFLFVAGPLLVLTTRPILLAAVGVAVVIAGIAGDLFESMLKRAADVKDSSALIPGHGGVLDRIDALLFATPVFYLYLRWAGTA